MRQWRVGTLSMGTLLIALGAGLIFAQISSTEVIEVFLKWWPLLFVLLGIEILGQLFLNKNDSIKIKYDIFSVFIIIIIVISGLSVQAFAEIGLTERARVMMDSRNYVLETEPNEIQVNPEIKRLVIELPPCDVQVYTSNDTAVVSYASADVSADSKEKALELLDDILKCNSHIAGDTMYLSFDLSLYGSEFAYNSRIIDCTLFVPDRLDVEVKGNKSDLSMDVRKLMGDWQIQDAFVELNLNQDSNVEINAVGFDKSQLDGNVSWNISGESKIEPDIAPYNDNGQYSYSEVDDMSRIKGQYKTGDATHRINIIDGERVTINQVP